MSIRGQIGIPRATNLWRVIRFVLGDVEMERRLVPEVDDFRREFGLDPEDASSREAATVERYEDRPDPKLDEAD